MEIASIDDLEIKNVILGFGGTAKVFLARHRLTATNYAVKLVELGRRTKVEIEALGRELALHCRLRHPNIVRLVAWFQRNSKLYIVLEHVERGNLFDYNRRALAFEEITAIFAQIVAAVAFLHANKVVHRDIKPENVLIDAKGNVKLCDFGFCAPVGEGFLRTTLCGTKEYLSPEIISADAQSEKVDIWCLGVLLYELIHKRTPFGGRSPLAFERDLRCGRVPLGAAVFPELHAIIVGCLAFEAERRPSARELLANPLIARHAPRPQYMSLRNVGAALVACGGRAATRETSLGLANARAPIAAVKRETVSPIFARKLNALANESERFPIAANRANVSSLNAPNEKNHFFEYQNLRSVNARPNSALRTTDFGEKAIASDSRLKAALAATFDRMRRCPKRRIGERSESRPRRPNEAERESLRRSAAPPIAAAYSPSPILRRNAKIGFLA